MGELDQPFDGISADSEREFSAKIADVDIRDDFMFSYVMCNPCLLYTSLTTRRRERSGNGQKCHFACTSII